jgi:hypothetical protein
MVVFVVECFGVLVLIVVAVEQVVEQWVWRGCELVRVAGH